MANVVIYPGTGNEGGVVLDKSVKSIGDEFHAKLTGHGTWDRSGLLDIPGETHQSSVAILEPRSNKDLMKRIGARIPWKMDLFDYKTAKVLFVDEDYGVHFFHKDRERLVVHGEWRRSTYQ